MMVKIKKQQLAYHQSLFSTSQPLRRALNLAILTILYPAFTFANPNGAQIVNGQVTINTATPGVTTVTNSPNAIINWQNFSIAQNELTQFIQQNSQSAVLNRIIGQNPSEILGQLISNGKVFLINPNGVVFGAGSTVDTQGLIASSLNLSDQDFLNGNYHFMAGSGAGNILNEGIIRAGKDSSVVLIAPKIENNGIIKSDGGSITLAAGQELTITNLDDPDIRFQIQAPADSALNLGKLLTEGGAINVFAGTIKHSGEINADSVQIDKQGNIQLVAQQDVTLDTGSKISANNNQGDAGTVHIESKTGTTLAQGIIQAKATRSAALTAGQTSNGGSIELLGERVGILNQAHVDASGENGGGQVLIGGDYQGKNPNIHNAKATYIGKDTTIKADAKTNGDGGKVIVWSDDSTRVYGNISAKGGINGGDGGFVETSGHRYLDFQGRVDTLAPKGKSGTLLLDPTTITIDNTADIISSGGFSGGVFSGAGDTSTLTWSTINTQLALGNLDIQTFSLSSTNVGDININASTLTPLTGPYTLTLLANNNINIANGVSVSGNGGINLVAGWNNTGWAVTPGTGNITFGSNSSLSTNGNIWFNAGNTISQGAGSTITANTLSITNTSGGGVNLSETNMVNTLSANIDNSNSFTFKNGQALTIGSGLFSSGISASGNTNPIDISTTSGNLTVSQPILSDVLGGSQITLTAANTLAINAAITSTFNATPAGPVVLQAGSGGVISNANGIITAAGLKVVSGGSVTLNAANVINTLAGSISGTGSEYFRFNNSGNLSIGTVAGLAGITIDNFPNYTPGSSNGLIALQAGGNISQTTTGTLSGAAVLANSSGGFIDLTAATGGNATGVLAGSADGGFSYKSSNTIALMNVDGHSGVSSSIGGNIVVTGTGFANSLATPFTTSGRWLVYAPNPASVTKGGLTSAFRQYNTLYGGVINTPNGNGFIYASTPGTLTVNTILASGAASSTYGTTPTAVFGYAIGNPSTADNEDLALIAGPPIFTPTLSSTDSAGSYTVSYLTGLTSAAGYTFTAGASLAYTITPALLSVTADSVTRIYGDANPVFTGAITAGSLANSDTLSSIGLAFTTSASPLSNVGVYSISPTITSSNYTLTGINGVLSITPALLSVTADSATRVYGNANPAFTGAITAGSLANSDTLSSIGLAFTTSATPLSKVGIYSITPTITSSNYTLTGIDGELNVTPLASVAWIGGNGNWSAASNWANNILPTTGNVLAATIPIDVTVTYDSLAGNTSLSSLNSLGRFQMTGGSLGISGNFNTTQYTQSGGHLSADSFNVSDNFNQSGGLLTANSISLNSDSSIAQGISGSINAANLTANGGGDVSLAGLNNVSGGLDISSGGNIYSRTRGVSQISRLYAPNGGIDVVNTGGFILGSVTSNGDINIQAQSPLTINGDISSTGGNVFLTANNSDILSINAFISALNDGIYLTGGMLTGSNSLLYTKYFNGGNTTNTTLVNTNQNIIATVLGTTTQENTPLDDESSSSNVSATQSTDPATALDPQLKQCVQ